uniref:Uncharacterized protein n=1 Tax=Neogobius melanostomus TaxID=47308 RepID=A0A8C6S5M4_9GOBI
MITDSGSDSYRHFHGPHPLLCCLCSIYTFYSTTLPFKSYGEHCRTVGGGLLITIDAGLCVSDTEERLLCSERSRFNANPFGLRFGKRQGGSGRGRNLQRRTNYLSEPATLVNVCFWSMFSYVR